MTQLNTTPTIATPVANKGFGTGKGTTQQIKDFFSTRLHQYAASDVGAALNLPARQLSKRLAELVKGGYLTKSADFGINEYRSTAKLNPNQSA